MFNLLKSVFNFCTKICDSIKNYVQHGEKQPCQEVGDVCISPAIELIYKVEKHNTLVLQ